MQVPEYFLLLLFNSFYVCFPYATALIRMLVAAFTEMCCIAYFYPKFFFKKGGSSIIL